MKVRLFTDKHGWCNIATEMVKSYHPDVEVVRGQTSYLQSRECDLIISFLHPYIIPGGVLDHADMAVNFHPGPKHYPGTGCYNFALYDDAKEYGAVCHHMQPAVDTGRIIEEVTFPVFERDTVETLQFRSYTALLGLLDKFLRERHYKHPVLLGDNWTSLPRTRVQLDALGTIAGTMDKEEVARRTRAMTYPGHPMTVYVGGWPLSLEAPEREPLAFRFFRY